MSERPEWDSFWVEFDWWTAKQVLFAGFPSLPPLALRIARAALVSSEISRRAFSAKAA